MRLDLFLKASRLCLRRSIAQQLCDAGLVSVNDRAAKSSHAVKPGDVIGLRIRNREMSIRVMKLPATKSVAKSDAAGLYNVISDEVARASRP